MADVDRKSDSNGGGVQKVPGAWVCIGRALKLRCPECGVSPIFIEAKRVRSIWNWFTPLDGCPRCGYAYERESGYFLMATWGVNYGIVAGLGLGTALVLDYFIGLKLWQAIAFVFLPMPVLSFLLARHAKALYLAMDHYFDPHVGAGKK
jgi:uncharacterized protein (DUF983 family)